MSTKTRPALLSVNFWQMVVVTGDDLGALLGATMAGAAATAVQAAGVSQAKPMSRRSLKAAIDPNP